METKWIEIPTKLRTNFSTIQFFVQLSQVIDSLSYVTLKLSFQKNCYIQPNMLATLGFFMHLAKSKGNQVVLVSVNNHIRGLLESYEILENKDNLYLTNGIPFRIFEYSSQETFQSYLDASLSKMDSFNKLSHVYAYLKSFFQILSPTLACSGYYNLKEDWLFFTMVSSKTPELDDFSFHLLVEEFQETGGKLWVVQGRSYYDLKETKLLNWEFSKTLIIIGFPLGTL